MDDNSNCTSGLVDEIAPNQSRVDNQELEKEPCDTLSKRQRKRMAKREQWEKEKKMKRAQERKKRKELRAEALARGENPPRRRKYFDMSMEKSSCHLRVAVDVSFDHLMIEQDISKTCKQLLHCYAVNRRASSPIQFYLTSFAGKTKEMMEMKHNCKNWDVHFKTGSFEEVFEKDDIVFLTSESSYVLDKLDQSKVYIIGGLVDHNKHKGLCLSIAEESGIHHARLPIEQFLKMSTRKVLAINHVFEILLKVMEGMSWEDALLAVLPLRKGATKRTYQINKLNITDS